MIVKLTNLLLEYNKIIYVKKNLCKEKISVHPVNLHLFYRIQDL